MQIRIPELAAEVGVPPERVINLHSALGGTGANEPEKFTMPHLFVDNCHMNDEGYALMAETIYNAVAPQLAVQP